MQKNDLVFALGRLDGDKFEWYHVARQSTTKFAEATIFPTEEGANSVQKMFPQWSVYPVRVSWTVHREEEYELVGVSVVTQADTYILTAPEVRILKYIAEVDGKPFDIDRYLRDLPMSAILRELLDRAEILKKTKDKAEDDYRLANTQREEILKQYRLVLEVLDNIQRLATTRRIGP